MDLAILRDEEGFRRQVIEALARVPLSYVEEMEFIDRQRRGPAPWDGAGVLLPLHFPSGPEGGHHSGEYVFLLNKRSSQVKQAGDLCAPGGGIHPLLDRLGQKALEMGLLPCARGPALDRARQRGKALYRRILFFLANALRESWEELRLNPCNVEFLGPLQIYRLSARNWIMFPLAGRVLRPWKPRLSWEVEKIVSIPLAAFFQPENYAVYSLEVPEKLVAQGIPDPWEFPCLVHKEDGEEEILWGATYQVIRSFLKILFGTPLPQPDKTTVIHRPLVPNYLSGRLLP